MTSVIEPIDDLHAECMAKRAEVRAAYLRLQAAAKAWEPQPMPVGWR